MDRKTQLSKLMSLILRHKPQQINLILDSNGWSSVQELINGINEHYKHDITFNELKNIVEISDKKRFIFSNDLKKIRANQGHSINIDLKLKEKKPPKILYHGTAERFLASIKYKGIISQERQYVHLSENIETATSVGSRHGKPVILQIKSLEMHDKSFEFFLSENNVWLTKFVPSRFIIFD